MKPNDLDRAFPQTPRVFSERIDQTLRYLKEEQPMRKITFRAVLVAAMVTLLVAGAAYAVISLGQEWYFNTRFTAYQEHEPDKHKAIMDNLQQDIAQAASGEAGQLVTFKILDASWAQEQNVFTLSLASSALSPGEDELHAYGDLDQDGAWAPEPDPNDPDIRTQHWLATGKGFGLPQDTMTDPAKRLLLLDIWGEFYIGDTQVAMPMWMSDQFTTPDGPVMGLFEFDLNQLDDDKINANYENAPLPEGTDKAEFERNQKDLQGRQLQRAKAMREAIAANTDEKGFLTLRFPYRVWPFDLEKNALGEAVDGETVFQVKIK